MKTRKKSKTEKREKTLKNSLQSPSKPTATTTDRHKRCRGTYYWDYILACISAVADSLGCSFSFAVNLLLDEIISKGLVDKIERRLALQVRRKQLVAEELDLKRISNTLLRSGPYLPLYAQKLFEGEDLKAITSRNKRLPLSALASAKELEVIQRIFARRKRICLELIEIEDKLLPEEKFEVGLEERGWTARSNRRRGKSQANQRKKRR